MIHFVFRVDLKFRSIDLVSFFVCAYLTLLLRFLLENFPQINWDDILQRNKLLPLIDIFNSN